MQLSKQLAWVLPLALLAAAVQSAHAVETYTQLKDSATGLVISLSLDGYRPNAGVAKSTMTADAVTAQAMDFVARHGEDLGISGAPADLVALPAAVDKLGLGHQRFALRHGGLPVYGGEVYIHIDPAVGVYYATIKGMGEAPPTLNPTLTTEDARQAALDWSITRVHGDAQLSTDLPELVILPLRITGDRTSNASRLAWRLRSEAENPAAFDEDCFVDAHDGAMLLHFSNNQGISRQIFDCNTLPATCAIDTWRSQYQYWFGRSEPYGTRGPHPIPGIFYGSRDVDLSYQYFGECHSYYQTKFNRDGGNDLGGIGSGGSVPVTASRALTHLDGMWAYCPAFAGFSRTYGQLQFCVGSVEAIDIFGHEYAHSIPYFTNAAVYHGETGALNEAHSDLVGDALEFQFSGSHNWILGESYLSDGTPFLSGLGSLTNMSDPGSFIQAETGLPYPDRFYSESVYCGDLDNGGVHYNMTVPGHSMFLVAEGGTFNGCTISPIGHDAVERIWYRAWTTYFSSTATFNEAYFALQQAAADLYPQEVVDQVRIALQAVEMDQPGACSGIPAVTPACAGVTAVPGNLVSPAEGSSIRYCGPNPSFGQATIEYALARDGEVDIAVYDISGRHVATVLREHQERGLHQATWAGRQAASGVYFVRVSVGGVTVGSEKLIVVR